MFGKEHISDSSPPKKNNYFNVNVIQSLKAISPLVKMALGVENEHSVEDNFKKFSHHQSVISKKIIQLLEIPEKDIPWVKNTIDRQVSEVISYHILKNKEIDWHTWYNLLPLIVMLAQDKTGKKPAFKKLKMENTHNIAMVVSFNKILLSWSAYKDSDGFNDVLKQSFDWVYGFSKKQTSSWCMENSSVVEKMELFRVWLGEVTNVFNHYFHQKIKKSDSIQDAATFAQKSTLKHFNYIDSQMGNIKM